MDLQTSERMNEDECGKRQRNEKCEFIILHLNQALVVVNGYEL